MGWDAAIGEKVAHIVVFQTVVDVIAAREK